ncbi:unnamed protein product [Clavelina lepadiformis]|uniref:Uncharacterized protein n=1 Tax=Clavelina lepadiformis TaxID=159417 RepID=A0ABP0EZ09_CLALP
MLRLSLSERLRSRVLHGNHWHGSMSYPPANKNLNYQLALSLAGLMTCPEVTNLLNSFRIGCIDDLYPRDMLKLLSCVEVVCSDNENENRTSFKY